MPATSSRQVDIDATDNVDDGSTEFGGLTPSPIEKIDGITFGTVGGFPPLPDGMSSEDCSPSSIPNQISSRPENYEAALKAMRDANPLLEDYPHTLQTMLSMLVSGCTPAEIGAAAQQLLAQEMKANEGNHPGTSGSLVADPKFTEHFVHEIIRSYQIESISDDGSRSTRTIDVILICRKPEIIVIPNALTSNECDLIKVLAKEQGYFDSQVRDLHVKANGKDIENLVAPMDYKTSQTVLRKEIRSSKTALIPSCGGDNGIIDVVRRRIASMVKLPYENLERMNVIRYEEGDQFVTHVDGHFRAATAYAFLDEPSYGGGVVDFSQLGFQINPKKGLVFAYTNNQAPISESVMAPQEALPALQTLHAFKPIYSKAEEEHIPTGDEKSEIEGAADELKKDHLQCKSNKEEVDEFFTQKEVDNNVEEEIGEDNEEDEVVDSDDSSSGESSSESESEQNRSHGAYFFFSLTEQSK